MKRLNLGCGNSYHEEWTNIDFVSRSKHVVAHNLLKGIPFEDNLFDMVYHSHVLEHFEKASAFIFLEECFRVLKSGGIIRVAVPDLEQIAKAYLHNLDDALNGDEMAKHNYEWIKLELLDQMVRNKSGGTMLEYLSRPQLINESYVYERLGNEARHIREALSKKTDAKPALQKSTTLKKRLKILLSRFKPLFSKRESALSATDSAALSIGRFRLQGEVHQWMYDRYSLKVLLEQAGFIDIKVCDAFNSVQEGWERFELDTIDGAVRKPDSLFMEAKKP